MKRKHRVCCIILFIISILMLCTFLCSINKIGYKKEIPTINEWIEIGSSLLGLIMTLLLGVVVYWQTEYFSSLEASQYDIFILAERILPDISLGQILVPLNPKHNLIDLHASYEDSSYSIISRIDTSGNSSGAISIPISFLTKNKILIKAINFGELQYSVSGKQTTIQDTIKPNADSIFYVLEDNSRINLYLEFKGIFLSDVNKILLNISFIVTDQTNTQHTIINTVELINTNDKLLMTSTQSREIAA